MFTATQTASLALLAICATLAQAGAPHAAGASRVAINPQPLPPQNVQAMSRVAINPQPLPPQNAQTMSRVAINPQPLPPETSRAAARNVGPRSGYIGDTEKN